MTDPVPINPDSGLTPREQHVAEALVMAWNDYVKLPQQHPDDLGEFREAINRAQGLLALRIARRSHPTYWITHPLPAAETEEVPA